VIPEEEITEEVGDETAGWQTYRKEEYGFEIKYPKDWETSQYGNKIWTFEFLGPDLGDYCDLQGHYGEVDLMKEVESYFSNKTIETTQQFEFNGYQGIKVKIADSEYVFITNRGFGYNFSLGGSNVCDEIFSTFRFIEQGPIRCITDEDCIIFGDENNANCGCFHKDSQWEPIEIGTYSRPVPTHCRCIDGACGVVLESNSPDFDLVYIKKIYTEKEKEYLEVDYIEWVGCDGGTNSECFANNGYVIMNYDPEIRTFEISRDIDIRMCSPSGYTNWDEKIPYERFKELLAEHSYYTGGIPFHIKIQNDKITDIKEQYIP